MRKRSVAAAFLSGPALIAGMLAAPQGAQGREAPKAVPHTKPAWLPHAQRLGHADIRSGVSARVYLSPRGGLAALKAAAVAVSTPGTSEYHHFLTSEQYQAQFGASGSTVSQVQSWLTSVGLHVTGVESANRYIAV